MHTYTHTLKHTQVCMCTQTNTHWNAIHFCSLIQVGAHASIVCEYASFTAKLLKRPKLCCQSAFCFHHFWRKPAFLHTWDMQRFILTVFSLAGTLITWLLVSVRTLADEAALCVFTHLTAGPGLFFTLVDVWGGKERKTKPLQWPRKIIHCMYMGEMVPNNEEPIRLNLWKNHDECLLENHIQ